MSARIARCLPNHDNSTEGFVTISFQQYRLEASRLLKPVDSIAIPGFGQWYVLISNKNSNDIRNQLSFDDCLIIVVVSATNGLTQRADRKTVTLSSIYGTRCAPLPQNLQHPLAVCLLTTDDRWKDVTG